MNAEQFDKILHETVSSAVETLASKAKEYAKGDRLYNFKRAAVILETTPEKALAGMIAKHLVSVLDLIEGTLPATEHMLNEKIGDTINYLILLKALLIENMERLECNKPQGRVSAFAEPPQPQTTPKPVTPLVDEHYKLNPDYIAQQEANINLAEKPKANGYENMLNYLEKLDEE